jgi:hypothetical protein
METVAMETVTANAGNDSINNPDLTTFAIDEKPVPTENLSHGVEAAEAVTLTWSKKDLILTFVLYVSGLVFIPLKKLIA